jgi:glycosyltransferase involved in cell wall biosynthesis
MNCPEAAPIAGSPARLSERLGVTSKIVIYIGALTWNRGIEQVIGAMRSMEGVDFALLGHAQPGYVEGIKSLVGRLGMAGRVHFLGSVPSAEVTRTASGADAAVILVQNACLSYYYCSPNKLFEALAAGLPVVASDFPDLRRVVMGQQVGLLCDPADEGAIRNALERVLGWPRDEVKLRALALAARYTWEVEGRKLLKVYASLNKGNTTSNK